MKIKKEVAPAFDSYIFDWDYETYVLPGSYGSGKSYHTAFKIILKLLLEKRKALVVREVFETIKESTFDLFYEIMDEMDLLSDGTNIRRDRKNKVIARVSPMSFTFPNGSKIIFKGMDKPSKIKSINGVSIVWLEEPTEIKYDGYKELLGRIRTPNVSMHFILTFNTVGRENWTYRHFFVRLTDEGEEIPVIDEKRLYDKKILVKENTYYLHTVVDDNPWAPAEYIRRLDEIKSYDYPLYMVARWGMWGPTGTRVLPQFVVAQKSHKMKERVKELGIEHMYFGFDFGFEESYNAVVCMTVDTERGTLYVWDEIYMNQITDDQFASIPEMQHLKRRLNDINNQGVGKSLIADSSDPKAITYYRQQGFQIRGSRNRFAGSRLSNTRKIKRFKRIVVSPKCKNTIRELKDLTYKKDSKGNVIYDQFNIDPHTFSAIWYGLDTVTVADIKETQFNTRKGNAVKIA